MVPRLAGHGLVRSLGARSISVRAGLAAVLARPTRAGRAAGHGPLQGQQLRQQGQVEQQQFQGCRRFRALHDAALGVKGHLPCGVQVRGRKLWGQFLPQGGLVRRQAQAGRNGGAALTQ